MKARQDACSSQTAEVVKGGLETWVKAKARALGFDLAGIAPADPLPDHQRAAQERVRQGYLEGMAWFSEARAQRAGNPQELLPGAQSVIVVGLSYLPPEEDQCAAGEDAQPPLLTGKVARYARWYDYHTAMKAKLRELANGLREAAGGPLAVRVFVDDGALLERAYAERAGLGWFGKHTNILTSSHGSWVLLGALVTDLALMPDAPVKKTCGACTRCMPACPTNAIVAPYVLDARRCISYLTIEHRGPIPRDLRPLMGDWVFGCDLCQEACPVNLHATAAGGRCSKSQEEPALSEVKGAGNVSSRRGAGGVPQIQFLPPAEGEGARGQSRRGLLEQGIAEGSSPLKRTGFDSLELTPLLDMTQEEFAVRFRNTPIKRAKLVGLQRNACIALGNLGDGRALPALSRALVSVDLLVRGHAAWALGRIGGSVAASLLASALSLESDLWVQEEISSALTTTQSASEYA